jgi:hypothetical protein
MSNPNNSEMDSSYRSNFSGHVHGSGSSVSQLHGSYSAMTPDVRVTDHQSAHAGFSRQGNISSLSSHDGINTATVGVGHHFSDGSSLRGQVSHSSGGSTSYGVGGNIRF